MRGVIAGVVLGAVVVVWQLGSAGMGWMAAFVPVAVLLQVVALVGLAVSQRQTHSGLAQLGSGTAASAVAAVMIFLGCAVLLPIVMPEAFSTLQAQVSQSMAADGATQEEIQAAVAGLTPIPQAVAGSVGTLITGVVVSAGLGAFLRKR